MYVLANNLIHLMFVDSFKKLKLILCHRLISLLIIKFLVMINPTYTYTHEGCKPHSFVIACEYSNIQEAQKLLRSDRSITKGDIDYAFLCTCNDRLKVAKWIYSVCPNVTIPTLSQICKSYNIRTKRSNIRTVKWICSISNVLVDDLKRSFERSLTSGDLRVAQWLFEHKSNDLQIDEKLFRSVCSDKTIKAAKWLYTISPSTDISCFDEYLFRKACGDGQLRTAQWLLQIKPDIDVSAKNGALCSACSNGHLNVVKWLCETNPDINISIDNESPFVNALIEGHLSVAKWLFKFKPSINVPACIDIAFSFACENGHLKVAKWLCGILPDIDISDDNEYAFVWSCSSGHVKLAKWLLQIKPTINVSINNNQAFNQACEYGYADVVELLLQMIPNIDVKTQFVKACERKYVDLAKCLSNYRPNDCILSLDEYGMKIISYHINCLPIIKPNIKQIESCSICYEVTANVVTNCSHQFCQRCLSTWHTKNKTCPCCRSLITYCLEI
jgi:ankyrin repeat protein